MIYYCEQVTATFPHSNDCIGHTALFLYINIQNSKSTLTMFVLFCCSYTQYLYLLEDLGTDNTQGCFFCLVCVWGGSGSGEPLVFETDICGKTCSIFPS